MALPKLLRTIHGTGWKITALEEEKNHNFLSIRNLTFHRRKKRNKKRICQVFYPMDRQDQPILLLVQLTPLGLLRNATQKSNKAPTVGQFTTLDSAVGTLYLLLSGFRGEWFSQRGKGSHKSLSKGQFFSLPSAFSLSASDISSSEGVTGSEFVMFCFGSWC